MKKLIVLVLLVLSMNSFSKDESWYKCFKGKIDNDAVTFNIYRYGTRMSGYYYYDKFKVPFTVIGDFHGDSLSIFSYVNSYSGQSLNGLFRSGVYSGELTQDESDIKHNFRVEEDKAVSYMFDYVFVTDEKFYFRNYDKSPNAIYSEGVIWPTDRNPDKDKLRYLISTDRNYPRDISIIRPELYKRQQQFFDGFFEQNKGLTKKEIEDVGYPSSWSLEEENHFQMIYNDDNIIAFSNFNYVYSGGAHGNYGTGHTVYDKKTKTALKLGELISDEGISKLPELLDKNYRSQNSVPDTVLKLSEYDLFVDTIYVTDNFYFTPGCFMFDYPPYDISSYAAGELKIYVPMEQLTAYLTPKALQLINRR